MAGSFRKLHAIWELTRVIEKCHCVSAAALTEVPQNSVLFIGGSVINVGTSH